MNLSRYLHQNDLFNVFGNSKYVWFCLKSFHNYVLFCKKCSSTLAAVDQAVLDSVENGLRKVLGNVKHFSNAIFVLGPMGAGKTTTIENCFKTHPRYKHYAYVDTDEIMGSIDDFTADKVELYYPLARMIAIRLTDWILQEKISFVAEGTCVKYHELIEYMERLKDRGYMIHVNRLPPVPLDVILRRSKHRKNRIIAEEVVASIYHKSNFGLDELYKYNKSCGYSLFEDLEFAEESCKKCDVKPLLLT